MNIVEVKAEEFGLEVEKAKEIELGFSPSIEKLNELKPAYDLIIQKEICPHVCDEAKELRLKFVKVRTETAKIHKAFKAFYLAGGRFVDAWKNKQTEISEQIENRLKEIEEHYERIELAKKQEQQKARLAQLSEIGHTGEGLDTLNMSDDLWVTVFAGLKSQFAQKLADEQAKREAEEKRIAEEKAEQERIKEENARLKAEQIAKEKEIAEERAKAEAEKRKQEQEIARLKAEQAKKEAEERAKAEAEAKAKAELEKAGDKQKIKAYFADLKQPPFIKDVNLANKFLSIIKQIEELTK